MSEERLGSGLRHPLQHLRFWKDSLEGTHLRILKPWHGKSPTAICCAQHGSSHACQAPFLLYIVIASIFLVMIYVASVLFSLLLLGRIVIPFCACSGHALRQCRVINIPFAWWSACVIVCQIGTSRRPAQSTAVPTRFLGIHALAQILPSAQPLIFQTMKSISKARPPGTALR